MRTRTLLAICGALSLACAGVACSNDSPAVGGNQTGQPGQGGGGEGGVTDSGGGTKDSGGGTDSGAIVDAGPALCAPDVPWVSNGRLPGLDDSTLSQFGSVSASELTLAWTNASGIVWIADRANTVTNFGSASSVDTSGSPLATDRVALSPTGSTFIAVSSDRSQFLKYSRSSPGNPWSEQARDEFSLIDALIAEGTGTLAEPVLGADRDTLYFMATLGANKPRIYESRYNTTIDKWASPSIDAAVDLTSVDATHRRRPTGASSDRRTLFFYDEVNGLEREAWRDSQDSPFTTFVDLSGFNEGTPNTDCTTLYFQSSDSDGGAVFRTE